MRGHIKAIPLKAAWTKLLRKKTDTADSQEEENEHENRAESKSRQNERKEKAAGEVGGDNLSVIME